MPKLAQADPTQTQLEAGKIYIEELHQHINRLNDRLIQTEAELSQLRTEYQTQTTLLGRYQADLQALQTTYSVRFSRAVGQVVTRAGRFLRRA